MRRLFIAIALGVAMLGSAAQASPLVPAGSSLTFLLGGNPPIVFQAAGTATGANPGDSATSFTLGAGSAFKGTSTINLTPNAAPPLSQIVITIMANAKGTFNGSPVAGVATVTGTALNKALGSTLLAVPIQLGKTGTLMAAGGGIKVTASGKKWTTGMTTVDLGGGMTVMTTGSIKGGAPGTVKLVAASKIVTNIGVTTFAIGQLRLQYQTVPEPALALLMVAGAATLGLVGSKKLRRR
jgi:hypothetical protein